MKRGKLQIKKQILILEVTRVITASSIYCQFFLSYYHCQKKIKKSQIATHCFTVFAVRYIGTMLKIVFPTSHYQEGFAAGFTLKYMAIQVQKKYIKGKSKRAELQRKKKLPPEKWDGSLPATTTKAASSTHSAEVGSSIQQWLATSFSFHPFHSFIFIEETAFLSSLQHTWSRAGLNASLQSTDQRLLGSVTLPQSFHNGQFFGVQYGVQKTIARFMQEFPAFFQNYYSQKRVCRFRLLPGSNTTVHEVAANKISGMKMGWLPAVTAG